MRSGKNSLRTELRNRKERLRSRRTRDLWPRILQLYGSLLSLSSDRLSRQEVSERVHRLEIVSGFFCRDVGAFSFFARCSLCESSSSQLFLDANPRSAQFLQRLRKAP